MDSRDGEHAPLVVEVSCTVTATPGLPPLAPGVIVLFAAMPTGANAYIFAAQYQRLVNPVSGAVALGTLLAAVTLPVVVIMVR